jgi:hypothetical protein
MKSLNQKGFTVVELVILILFLIPLAIFGIPWLVWKAWIWIAEGTFGWPMLSYWQVFAIWFILAMIGNMFRTTVKKE